MSDIVQRLQAGADDYILKPVRPTEFVARVQSVLRRAYPTSHSGCEKPIRYGDLTVDYSHHQA